MAAKKVEKAKGARPGGVIVSGEGLELSWGTGRRQSIYVALLEQLLDAPKESVLECENLKARYSITKAARKVGVTVAFAESNEILFCKITGMKREGLPAAQNPERKVADGSAATILRALASGPLSLKEVARIVGATPMSCADVLTTLVQRGAVEGDGSIYRVTTPKRGA